MRKSCIIVTCFSENQPGFLDFSYRIKALSSTYALTILSQDELKQDELFVPDATYRALGRGHGKGGWLAYLYRCATYIKKVKPDFVVLLHSSASPITLMIGDIPSCLYWNEHPTNLVHLPDGFAPIKYLIAATCQKLIFLGARFADLVMPIGEEHRDDLIKHNVASDSVHMVYMGVSDNFQSNRTLEDSDRKQQLKLVYIGSVSELRGRDVMLEGMARVVSKAPNIHLTIIGATQDQIEYCNRKVHQLGIIDAVQMMGRVPGESIPDFLRDKDIGICLWEDKPWWRFNPPTKLFEYLVSGLPVLVSDIRTHTRYIQNWENGIVFEYGADDFARAVLDIYNHQDRLPALKIASLSSGKQYLWSKIEPTFMQEIEKVSKK